MFQDPYLPSGVTNQMIDEALGDYGDIPEKYCVCAHCENYDGPWQVCKLKCQRAGIDTENSKEMDKALYALSDEEFDEKFFTDCDETCDDFEYDRESIEESPYDEERW